jgi:hypothetical protein
VVSEYKLCVNMFMNGDEELDILALNYSSFHSFIA